MLGRFDGVTASYSFLPKWRVNLIGGEPVEFNPINSDKLLWGANVDFGTFAEHWNGNVYYVYQDIDDINDRRAVGTELRYFDPSLSVMLLTDPVRACHAAISLTVLALDFNGATQRIGGALELGEDAVTEQFVADGPCCRRARVL